MSKLALIDMDGTLSDDRARAAEYIKGTYSSYWDRDRMLADPVFEPAADLIKQLAAEGWEIGVLTARLEDLNREITEVWLENQGYDLYPIYLRPRAFESLNPSEYKSFVVHTLIQSGKYQDVVLYDNDLIVVGSVTKAVGPQHVVYCGWDTEGLV